MQQEKYVTPTPKEHQHGLRFINSNLCKLKIDVDGEIFALASNSASEIVFIELANPALSVQYTDCSGNLKDISSNINSISMLPEEVTDVVLLSSASAPLLFDMDVEKTEDCKVKLYTINTVPSNITYTVNGDFYELEALSKTHDPIKLERGIVEIGAPLVPWSGSSGSGGGSTNSLEFEVACSGIYTIVFEDDTSVLAWEINDIYPNVINVGWVIPQYVVITCAEILVSITGLEFSYSQAPPSMKSVISAIWLFTVAIGNVIVLIIAEARIFEDQSNEFFLFAGLVLAACVIFGWLSYRYVLVDQAEFAEEIIQEKEKARKKALLYKRQKEAKKTGKPINYLEMEDDYEKPVKM